MTLTDKQASFIQTLLQDRQPDEALAIEAGETAGGGDKRVASGMIERLLNAPKTAGTERQRQQTGGGVRVTEPGVYRNSAGEVFIVKPSRENPEKLYAKVMVERPGIERLAEDGSPIYGVDFNYAPGAVYSLSPDDRMPFEDAKALTARYRRCIVCGAHLKQKESVERGIGPVCRTRFPDAGDPVAPPQPVERIEAPEPVEDEPTVAVDYAGDDDGQAWAEFSPR